VPKKLLAVRPAGASQPSQGENRLGKGEEDSRSGKKKRKERGDPEKRL
jgi:hypothetical protein